MAWGHFPKNGTSVGSCSVNASLCSPCSPCALERNSGVTLAVGRVNVLEVREAGGKYFPKW